MPTKSIVLAGRDEGRLMRAAYPALTAAGIEVMCVVADPDQLPQALAIWSKQAKASVIVVVEADLYPTADEAVKALSQLAAPVALILPALWTPYRPKFAAMPNLVAGFPGPVSRWDMLAQRLTELKVEGCPVAALRGASQGQKDETQAQSVANANQLATSQPITSQPATSSPSLAKPARPPKPQALKTRVGFCGARGGAGVSTAALTAARLLAAEGLRVVLFDATGRGDLHLMAGFEPTSGQVVQEGVTFFLDSPTEDLARGFDAIIVDGGRKRSEFNVMWIELDGPLAEAGLRKRLGLPPAEDTRFQEAFVEERLASAPAKQRAKKGRLLGGLINVEVTD